MHHTDSLTDDVQPYASTLISKPSRAARPELTFLNSDTVRVPLGLVAAGGRQSLRVREMRLSLSLSLHKRSSASFAWGPEEDSLLSDRIHVL